MASQISPIACAIVLLVFWTTSAAYGTAQEPQALLLLHPASALEAKLPPHSFRDAAWGTPHCGLEDNSTRYESSDTSEEGQSSLLAAGGFTHNGVIEVRSPVLVDVRRRSPRYTMLPHFCRCCEELPSD